MANIAAIVAGIEVELEAAKRRESNARESSQAILDQVQREGRSHMTVEEDIKLTELRRARNEAAEQFAGIQTKLARAKALEADEIATEARLNERTRQMPANDNGGTGRNYDTSVRIGEEAKTYNRGTDPDGSLFLADVAKATLGGDIRAAEKVNRHRVEFERDWSAQHARTAGDLPTTAIGSVAIPQYLVDMSATAITNAKPFADACSQHVLPSVGMSLTIPQLTATSAGVQSTELTSVSATSMSESEITLAVHTVAGQQLVSQQAIQRSAIGPFVVKDLMVRVNAKLDEQLFNVSTHGLVAIATAYNSSLAAGGSTAATAESIYSQVLGAASAVDTALSGVGQPDLVVMHPRRWRSLQAALVSAWPLVGRNGGGFGQPVGDSNGQAYGGASGALSDFKVISDRNVATNLGTSTNNDIIYITSHDECHLWTPPGSPMFIQATQPAAASLGVLMVCYTWYAATFERYSNSVQSITGNGLATPSFT